MKHCAHIISAIFLIFSCCSCDIKWRNGDYEYNPEIVIDGWIEAGKGETVSVMLAQIDETSFNFWSDYENEISNGKNILFPSSSNLRSNVSGGRGIWCGYNSDTVEITIE